MKKFIILFLTLVLTYTLTAQTTPTRHKIPWFDLRVTQHFGLNSWSNAAYVNDGLPATALTEFRGTFNIAFIKRYAGIFTDIGLGIMPAPKMQLLNMERLPMPYSGTPYYLRETLSETGNISTSTHFKMTFGLFGRIPANENLNIMPCFGLGFLTMPYRKHEIMLKEEGSNMQYRTIYLWNSEGRSEQAKTTPLGYLTGRLNFKYKLSQKSDILLGLEYTWFLDTIDFYGRYTNIFNANIEKDFVVQGNKVNMFGVSVGISF